MATNTTNYSFKKPTVSGDSGVWGGYLNDDLDDLDGLLGGDSPITGIDINSGAIDNATIGAATPNTGAFTTLSASSTFTLGATAITATGTEINVLDGIPATLTATELGYCDGVSSAIQTQLDSRLQTPVIKATADSPVTVVEGDFIVVKNGGITLTLPSTPSAGDNVTIKDGTGAAASSSFTVGRNGSNIASAASDLTFDKNWAEITMTYVDATIGWSV